MSDHPYRHQPDAAFWSRAVSEGFDPAALARSPEPLLRAGDLVVSAGSCFASNLVPWIESWGLAYLRTEAPHPSVAHLPENLGYRGFSAAYGNIYTARQLRQLYERATGAFRPDADRWHVHGHVVDPFRPGLRYPAASDAEFDLLTAQHLAAVREAFESATVMVVTLGLTEAWQDARDGAVYPACPGTIDGEFDASRHVFRNAGAHEVAEDLRAFMRQLRTANPSVRFILTVSPVPLVATATDRHVLAATTYSKSVLRVAAQAVVDAEPGVAYFPAYEIVTGPQAPWDYFAPDRRNVTDHAVAAVMGALRACSDLPAVAAGAPVGPGPTALPQDGDPGAPAEGPDPTSADVSRRIAQAECDEALLDDALLDNAGPSS